MWHKSLYAHPARGTMKRPAEALKHLLIDQNHPKGIAHLQLNRPPVNSINGALLRELDQWLLYLGSEEKTKAVVISSSSPGIFTAGLDFHELSRPTKENFAKFWTELQEMWLILNTFPKPIVAAINGNSPAGGCVIAMACDRRVMARQRSAAVDNSGKPAKQFVIGLNETQLGLVAPPFVAANFAYLIGEHTAEKKLEEGALIPADEALSLGLVDHVTENPESCVETAFTIAEGLLKVSTFAHVTTRAVARSKYMEVLTGEGNRAKDTLAMTDLVLDESVQAPLDKYVAAIKGKSAAK